VLIDKQSIKNTFTDPSLWLLLVSNMLVIFFAIIENWNVSTTMWAYWFQSVIIGYFNFIRILQLKEFSTEGYSIGEVPAQPTVGTKIFTAYFFLFHYGFFHFVYAVFLLQAFTKTYGSLTNLLELKYIFLTALFFFISHLSSYFYNRPRDTKKQNIGTLMVYPYVRVIPMHFTILLGSKFGGALFLFLVLKTFADLAMHSIEHNVLRKGEA